MREGIIVNPTSRLLDEQIQQIDLASLAILQNIGIECFNEEAAGIFAQAGANVTAGEGHYQIKIPPQIVREAIEAAQSVVRLGARDKANQLILDAEIQRVYFVSGSETNNYLEVDFATYISEDGGRKRRLPEFSARPGTTHDLADAAHLAENLDNLDSFIRTVNIQDKEITTENKDVNKFFICLDNTTKHVMGGLTSLSQLDNVLEMAEIIAGGKEALRKNPLISFITCVVKSPLQLVDDTTQNLIEMVRRRMPVVISSSPQGGSTAPITEAGMVAQINAEILTGITLAQLVRPQAPVLYGSVPNRARLSDLYDSYGAPEFSQYNVDCVQMARFYKIPCYSTAGVADTKVPGIQATMEKIISYLYVASSGPQYLHYAFGLLERTATFSPLQAVIDDECINLVKHLLKTPKEPDIPEALDQIRDVMSSKMRLFTRYIRKHRRQERLYPGYPFESRGMEDKTLELASQRLDQLLARPRRRIGEPEREKIFKEIDGILPWLKEEI